MVTVETSSRIFSEGAETALLHHCDALIFKPAANYLRY